MGFAQSGVDGYRQPGTLTERHRRVSARRRSDDTISSGCRLCKHLGGGDGLHPSQIAQVGVELALIDSRLYSVCPCRQHARDGGPSLGFPLLLFAQALIAVQVHRTSGQSRHNRSSA